MARPLVLLHIFIACCLAIIGEVRSGSAQDDDAEAPADCVRALDVVFLVEGGSQVSQYDWTSSQDIVLRVSSQLNVSRSYMLNVLTLLNPCLVVFLTFSTFYSLNVFYYKNFSTNVAQNSILTMFSIVCCVV